MAKYSRKISKDQTAQPSLLDLIERAAALRDGPDEGSLQVQPALSLAMSRAIRDSGLSRYEIAGRMSELVGQDITKSMLDAWTAESKEQHRPPAEFLPAFCVASGSREPLLILADKAGYFCLPGPDALRAEIQRLAEEEKEVRAERLKRQRLLKDMEAGR